MTYPAEQKRLILSRFLALFTDNNVKTQIKLQALQVLILPMLEQSFLHCDDNDVMLDSTDIGTIVTNMIESSGCLESGGGSNPEAASLGSGGAGVVSTPTAASTPATGGLRGSGGSTGAGVAKGGGMGVELLQFAMLFVKYMPESPVIASNRKNLIRFAWQHVKSEDTTTKMSVYTLLCHFIVAYQDTPLKIIIQVYGALLRHNQAEARHLVRKALDILTPNLPSRFPPGSPHWVFETKKVLIEEGHAVQQLVHLFHLIVRHPDLFYEHRGLFVPHMIPSMLKIGSPSSGSENKVLALDILELLLNWEMKTKKENEIVAAASESSPSSSNGVKRKREGEDTTSPTKKQKTEDNSNDSSVNPHPFQTMNQQQQSQQESSSLQRTPQHVTKATSFTPQNHMIELAVSYLIRIATSSSRSDRSSSSSDRDNHRPDRQHGGETLSSRALSLLRRLLGLFPEFQVKSSHCELGDHHSLKAGLRVLDVVFESQMVRFLRATLGSEQTRFHQMMNLALGSRDEGVVTLLADLFPRITNELPPDPSNDFFPFYKWVLDTLEQHLRQCYKWMTEGTSDGTNSSASGSSQQQGQQSSSSSLPQGSSGSSTGGRGTQKSGGSKTSDLHLCCLLRVLLVLSRKHPEFVDRFYNTLLEIFQRKCLDVPRSTGSEPSKLLAFEAPLKSVRLCLELLALRPQIQDIREQMYHSINELVDRTGHPLLISDILCLVRRTDEDLPKSYTSMSSFYSSLKQQADKTGSSLFLPSSSLGENPDPNEHVSQKLVHTLHLSDKQMLTLLTKLNHLTCGLTELERQYLRCLYDVVCGNPNDIPSSSRMELELHGMCSKNSDYRRKFLGAFCSRIEMDVHKRMLYILNPNTWEPIARYYWIRLALAQLATVVTDEDVQFSVGNFLSLGDMLTERENTETMEVGGEGGDGAVGMEVDAGEGDGGLTETQKELFTRHMKWLDEEKNRNSTRRFMNAVRDLGVFDKLSAQVSHFFLFFFLFFSLTLPPGVIFSSLPHLLGIAFSKATRRDSSSPYGSLSNRISHDANWCLP